MDKSVFLAKKASSYDETKTFYKNLHTFFSLFNIFHLEQNPVSSMYGCVNESPT